MSAVFVLAAFCGICGFFAVGAWISDRIENLYREEEHNGHFVQGCNGFTAGTETSDCKNIYRKSA